MNTTKGDQMRRPGPQIIKSEIKRKCRTCTKDFNITKDTSYSSSKMNGYCSMICKLEYFNQRRLNESN